MARRRALGLSSSAPAVRFGDAPVQVHDAYSVTHRPATVEVIGTDSSVPGVGILAQEPDGTLWRTANGETSEIQVPDHRDLYEIVLDAFRSAIAGTGRPTVDGASGLSALAGALAVAESPVNARTIQVADIA